jgi:CoA-binding domain
MSFTEEIRRVIYSGMLWFLFYTSFVYLTTGYLFEKEIPRLIVIYVSIFATFFSIVLRFIVNSIYNSLIRHGKIEKRRIIIIHDSAQSQEVFENDIFSEYLPYSLDDQKILEDRIRAGGIEAIIVLSDDHSKTEIRKILELARIYGITFCYPKIRSGTPIPKQQESSI